MFKEPVASSWTLLMVMVCLIMTIFALVQGVPYDGEHNQVRKTVPFEFHGSHLVMDEAEVEDDYDDSLLDVLEKAKDCIELNGIADVVKATGKNAKEFNLRGLPFC